MGRPPNPVPRTEPTPGERAYLAGLVDAEGHFGYRTDPLKLKFCLTGRERDLLEQVAAWVGGRVFEQPRGDARSPRSPDPRRWRLEIYSRDAISRLIDLVSPYVRSARIREQIALIVSAMER